MTTPNKLEETMKKFAFALSIGVVGLLLMTTAVFAQGTAPDHLLCYKVQDPFKLPATNTVNMLADLQPEFTQKGCTLLKPVEFCVPAVKVANPPPPNNIGGQPLQNDYICYVTNCPKQGLPPSKIVTDQFGQHTEANFKPVKVCVPAIKAPRECPAGDKGVPCLGACPTNPNQKCHLDKKSKLCTCASTTLPPCGKPDSSGACGGDCTATPGTVCSPTVSATGTHICACLPPPPPACGLDLATGTCGGQCLNPADKCVMDTAGRCTCQNVPLPCGKDPTTGQCGGGCPAAGQTCALDSTGACSCTPPASCGQDPLTGTCGGNCPTAGDQCVLDTAGKCNCVPPVNVPCGINAAGVCGGACPLATQQCTTDATTGACNCQPPPCASIAGTTTCGGACPPGLNCGLTTTAPVTCACQ